MRTLSAWDVAESDLGAPERLAIDYADAADLADKSAKALKALEVNQAATWKALRAQGIFRGSGPAPKVAFLYTGQGSQYPNMLQQLRADEPIVAETFAEADRVMTLQRAWSDGQRIIGQMTQDLPSDHYASDGPTSMAPRLIELCFQTAGLWGLAAEGKMGLPHHVDRVCLWREPNPADGPLYAVVTPDTCEGSFDADVVDAAGNCYLRLSGYHVVELPGDVDAGPLKALLSVAQNQYHMAAAD